MDTLENILGQDLEADRPTLAMFYSPADPRCRQELPVMRKTARLHGGQAHYFEVDVDKYPDLKEKYHIHAYPTFILFSDGQEAWRAEGRLPESELADMVHRFA